MQALTTYTGGSYIVPILLGLEGFISWWLYLHAAYPWSILCCYPTVYVLSVGDQRLSLPCVNACVSPFKCRVRRR